MILRFERVGNRKVRWPNGRGGKSEMLSDILVHHNIFNLDLGK